MNRGKAADLDGITVEHVCYSSGMLPRVLSKFFFKLVYVSWLRTSEFWLKHFFSQSTNVHSASEAFATMR